MFYVEGVVEIHDSFPILHKRLVDFIDSVENILSFFEVEIFLLFLKFLKAQFVAEGVVAYELFFRYFLVFFVFNFFIGVELSLSVDVWM